MSSVHWITELVTSVVEAIGRKPSFPDLESMIEARSDLHKLQILVRAQLDGKIVDELMMRRLRLKIEQFVEYINGR